eukprot:6833152-Prymnesium_polylepis.1
MNNLLGGAGGMGGTACGAMVQAAPLRAVEVLLPPEAQPGQKLRLSVRGHDLVFVVPPHMSGGCRMAIGLPSILSDTVGNASGGAPPPPQVSAEQRAAQAAQ